MFFLYNTLGWLLTALSFPFFLVYGSLHPGRRQEIRQRLGLYPPVPAAEPGRMRIWIHAASVGEVRAAEALIDALASRFAGAAIIITTVTRHGREIACQRLSNRATVLFAPLDLPIAAQLAARDIAPDLYICLETELWPNLLAALAARGTRLVLANGRMSERSHRRYRLLPGLTRKVLRWFHLLAVISETDASRYRSLGAPEDRIHILGNVKYDSQPPAGNAVAEEWRQRLALGAGQPVLVTGSTHSGEEALLAETWRAAKKDQPGLVWIIAPRHLRRIDEVRRALTDHGLGFQLLTDISQAGRIHDIVLVDTMGDLAGLYSVAAWIFCGGSLVERGGHNIMEAAAWGRPVFYGPSMKDFEDARQLLEEAGAGYTVANAAELAQKILYFVGHPEEYRQAGQIAGAIAAAQQGSASRHAALIAQVCGRLNAGLTSTESDRQDDT